MSGLARPRSQSASRAGLRPRVRQRLRTAALTTLFVSAPLAVQGFLAPSAVVLSFAASVLAFGFVLLDVAQADRGGLTPITVYALFAGVTSFANGIGLTNVESSQRSLYFLYAVDEYLDFAARLNFASVLLPILGFRLIARSPLGRAAMTLLPSVEGSISDRTLVITGTLLSAAAMGMRFASVLPNLGTITAMLFLLPQLVVFVLARVGHARRVRGAIPAALLIMAADATRAAVTGYLRSEIIAPVFAFVLGALMGARTLRPLRSPSFMPIYAIAVLFSIYFAAFGQIRATAAVGAERFAALQEQRMRHEESPLEGRQTLLSRLSNFNQLTQVRRLVHEDGLLMGATLDYLPYAFIPRFVWPEKPLIAKGAWFALRIGQANLVNGTISNSINMTVAGEFYLNYGWTGALFGLPLYGMLLAIPWLRAHFWRSAQNTLGSAFGFFLMLIGAGAAADLQILVTMIATYLLFVAAGLALRGSQGPTRRGPRVTRASAAA